MQEILLVSNILLWTAVISLLLVVLALLRQIGVLYERVAPAGALMINKQIKVGEAAPEIALQEFSSGRRMLIGGAEENGRSRLLFFIDSDCPVCKVLLPMVKSAKQSEKAWLDIILAGDGEEDAQKKFIAARQLQDFDFINSSLLGRSYGVSKLPYAVLLDEAGIVRSMGIINSREHLESLFQARELGVASIQDYMQKQTLYVDAIGDKQS